MLRDDIIPYTDGLGLVAPHIVEPGTIRSCDNGILFLSEYYILLAANGEFTNFDRLQWANKVRDCMLTPGLLARAPGDRGLEGPDDHLGVLAAAQVLGVPSVAQDILSYGVRHLGFFNNESAGSFKKPGGGISWGAFLWRQPQLYVASLTAARKLRAWHLPLVIYTALVILMSCKGVPAQYSDPRRLGWLLIKIMEPNSLLCKAAAWFWRRRLKRDYGYDMMLAVSRHYYSPGHPFTKYKWE